MTLIQIKDTISGFMPLRKHEHLVRLDADFETFIPYYKDGTISIQQLLHHRKTLYQKEREIVSAYPQNLIATNPKEVREHLVRLGFNKLSLDETLESLKKDIRFYEKFGLDYEQDLIIASNFPALVKPDGKITYLSPVEIDFFTRDNLEKIWRTWSQQRLIEYLAGQHM